MVRLLETAAAYAPECLLRPDHTPTMAGESNRETGYTMLGNLFAVGYIRGILDTQDKNRSRA
jgi:mannonate dehydratase